MSILLEDVFLELRALNLTPSSSLDLSPIRGDGSAINSHLLSYGLNIERHREGESGLGLR